MFSLKLNKSDLLKLWIAVARHKFKCVKNIFDKVALEPSKRWNIFVQTMETKGFYQFEIIINVFVSSLCFIWIPMLWGRRPLEIFLLLQRGDRL